ncbi:MAG: hypothetical protein IIZ67_03190 [Bacilli bacterium]|nr:hypothetical protein [Bacilli bacterium]
MANSVIPSVNKINNSGGSRYYILNRSQLLKIQNFLMDGSFLNSLHLLFDNANQYVVGLKVFPCNISKFSGLSFASAKVKCGNVNVKDLSNNTDITATYLRERASGYISRWATYDFTEYFNSFLDYEPYTKYQIYLPYCDFIDIDINLYMGKKLVIDMFVDFATGDVMYSFRIGSNVIETHNGKIGIDIPLSQSNASEIARNNLLTIANATKNLLGVDANYTYKTGLKTASKGLEEFTGIQTTQIAIQSGIDFVNANQKKFNKSSTPSGYLDFWKPQNAYLIRSRPNVVIPNDYARLKGIPSGKTCRLGDLTGYTEVEDIHLNDFYYATKQELSEIETKLKSGVIL